MMDHIFNELLALTRAGLMDVPLETDISPEDWKAIIKIAEEQNLRDQHSLPGCQDLRS